jgi:NADPH:quinone reductase-like Zn-dependent oxidoreductase
MKAVTCPAYGPPEVLKIIDVEKPLPRDSEVLIRIYATTVTVADFRIRSFTVPPSFWIPARIMLGLARPKKHILGVELSGKIESIGKDVILFNVGDDIFAATLSDFGAYAEYKCLPENSVIAIKPANVS